MSSSWQPGIMANNHPYPPSRSNIPAYRSQINRNTIQRPSFSYTQQTNRPFPFSQNLDLKSLGTSPIASGGYGALGVNPLKIAGLFGAGALSAVALHRGLYKTVVGRWFRQKLGQASRQTEKSLNLKGVETLKTDRQEQQTWISLNDKVPAMLGTVFSEPKMFSTFMLYLGASGAGYIAGSLLKGVQDALVWQAETQVRVHLLNQMRSVFQQSLQLKSGMDEALKNNAKHQISQLLAPYGISLEKVLESAPQNTDSNAVWNLYPYKPISRSQPLPSAIPIGNMRFGLSRFGEQDGAQKASIDLTLPTSPHENLWRKVLDGGSFVIGALTGFLGLQLSRVASVMPGSDSVADKAGAVGRGAERVLTKTINLQNAEALYALKDFRLLGMFFLVSAAAKAGKTLVDTFRAIQVTRLNAATELQFQRANWLNLDPNFRQMAEENALNDQLDRFREQLPTLTQNPVLLRRWVQTMLDNVGKNSAPPYFPMTPPVTLSY